MNSFSQSIKHTPGSFDYKIFFGVKVKRKSHDVSTSSRSDSQKYHRPLKFSLLMATYSIFILLLIFFQNHEGNENQLMMFSTKKIWKVTIFWLGMENGFWFEKNETPPYCKSSLCCVISVSDSSVHFVAEFLHCSVKSGLSLQPWESSAVGLSMGCEPTSRGALYDCFSCFKTIFFFTAFIIK